MNAPPLVDIVTLQRQLHQRQRLADLLRLPLALAAALATGFLILCVVSERPVQAFAALTTGAVPRLQWSAAEGWQLTRLVRFGALLEDATTLCLLGLAVAIPFQARQFSLGADGQMFLGALAATAVGLSLPQAGWLALPLAISAACLTGFAWGALPGLLKTRCQASEIVTTLMLNIIAIQLYRWVVTDFLRDPGAGFIVTPLLPEAMQLPLLIARTKVNLMLLLLPLAVGAAWLLLMRTTLGYEIRTVGQAPAFALHAGMPVKRAVWVSMAAGGVFAGLAGVHLSHGLLDRLPVDLPPGMGYEGLLVALLARNAPRDIPLAALLYAWLRTGALAMERSSDVPHELVLVIQALAILFVVAERLLPSMTQHWQRWRARSGR